MEKKNGAACFNGGMLYLCATPIGNLRDITLRVLDCLKCADLVAAENPRHTQKLLNYYGVKAPLTSYREANREKKSRDIINRLKEGAMVVLLSDAGMPGISDPGFYLIRKLIEEEIPYTVLPGASAVLTALISSAYPGTKFVFWGFLSRKKSRRRRELKEMAREEKTIVLYESPHRLMETLEEMAEVMERREMTVCRELTKKFEEVVRGTPGYLLEYFSLGAPQGEFTLVISPLDRLEGAVLQACPTQEYFAAVKGIALKKILEYLKNGSTPAGAAKKVASVLPISRRQAYLLMLELKERHGLE
jgi:16S rRNA (cytidine1402-2'-O)-methyltransferase